MSHSFKSLRREGTLRSRDLFRVKYSDLVVIPGQSGRDEDERFHASIDDLEQYLLRGGKVPPLEVQVNQQTGAVEIVQGHRRHIALGRVIPAKQQSLRDLGAAQKDIDELEWVDCLPFEGNDLAKVARISSGNNHLPLTEVERARNYLRLQNEFGLDAKAIADLVGEKKAHVELHLALAAAPHTVQQQVQAGAIAATEAVKLVREHGAEAAQVIEQEKAKAAAQGKRKVTAGTMHGRPLPKPVVADLVGRVQDFTAKLPTAAVEQMARYRLGEIDNFKVEIDGVTLFALVAAHQNVETVRANQEAKIQKRLAKQQAEPKEGQPDE